MIDVYPSTSSIEEIKEKARKMNIPYTCRIGNVVVSVMAFRNGFEYSYFDKEKHEWVATRDVKEFIEKVDLLNKGDDNGGK